MFLYFKRREKRGKREAPRPRFLVLRRKTLTVGAALLAAAAIFGAVNAPAAVRASVATRQLPIYCVERDQKVCSISFDAAWGGRTTRRRSWMYSRTTASRRPFSWSATGRTSIRSRPRPS